MLCTTKNTLKIRFPQNLLKSTLNIISCKTRSTWINILRNYCCMRCSPIATLYGIVQMTRLPILSSKIISKKKKETIVSFYFFCSTIFPTQKQMATPISAMKIHIRSSHCVMPAWLSSLNYPGIYMTMLAFRICRIKRYYVSSATSLLLSFEVYPSLSYYLT